MTRTNDGLLKEMTCTDGLMVSQQLKDVINATFNTSKGSYRPTDYPFFCVKCAGKSMTPPEAETCRSMNHIVFQAMKCSGIYGFLKSDIDKIKKIENVNNVCVNIKDELNVDHVCAFSVNNAMIYFPKTRTQKVFSSIDIGSKCCMTCGFDLKNRNQIKTDLFCSILCKLKCKNIDQLLAMVENTPASRNIIRLPLKRDSKKIKKNNIGDEKKKKKSPKISIAENNINLETLSVVAKNDGNKSSTSIFSLRKRCRKGVHRVPTRAPLK